MTTNTPSETELLACKTCGHHANRHGHIIGDNSGACFVPSAPGGHLCPCNEFTRPIPPNASLTTRAAAFLTAHWDGKEPTTTLLAETMAAFVEEETAVAPVDEVGAGSCPHANGWDEYDLCVRCGTSQAATPLAAYQAINAEVE